MYDDDDGAYTVRAYHPIPIPYMQDDRMMCELMFSS